MAVFVNPDTIHRPATSGPNLIAPAAWGDTVNDDLNFLASTVGAAVATVETTTSLTYTALATPGPAVTVTTGGKALVFCRAYIANSSALQDTFMGVAVSGATTIAATDVMRWGSPVANAPCDFAGFALILSLNSGVNTFTAQYQVGGGTGTFGNRNIVVVPLP